MLNICASSLTLRPHFGCRPTGAKRALKPVHAWGIRIRLQVGRRLRDLALSDLALEQHRDPPGATSDPKLIGQQVERRHECCAGAPSKKAPLHERPPVDRFTAVSAKDCPSKR